MMTSRADETGNNSDLDNIIVCSGRPDPRPAPSIAPESTSPSFDTHDPAPIEQDISTASSSVVSDPFDHATSQERKWGYNGIGSWGRMGSSESATSTAISSNTSSIANEPKSAVKLSALPPGKKRLLDGTFKQPTSPLDEKPPSKSSPALSGKVAAGATPPAHAEDTQKKRRGRPPKDKSSLTGSISKTRRASTISKLTAEDVRPRSSIPSRVPVNVFANQCIEAAHASRLNPFSLHPGEHELLADLILDKEVTIYLNIRNAMLRMWHHNPLCMVTPEEAAGCAKEARFFGLAEVAYKWLVRNGYINFGCAEVLKDRKLSARAPKTGKQRTVVVVGAGVSGLTTARQLESLFAQNAEEWVDKNERPPRVIVLEGRHRIGGRVYSKQLRSQEKDSLPDDLRTTAEMGAMIVTGFEHGNPLNTVIRGQLGLRYHLMTDSLTIYDSNGLPVDEQRDMLNTELYTDISDRTGAYRATPTLRQTLHGDEDLIKRCRDPAQNGFETDIMEPLFDPLDPAKKPTYRRGRRRNAPPGTEKITGRSRVVEESGAVLTAARAAKEMGWLLREGVSKNQSVSLHRAAKASNYPTLGAVMDTAIEQYQNLVHIKAKDMRLLNWHHANLEYANAAPVSSLSLSGHDQDTGNEFEGAHSEIIGGYSQLPRGLMNLPTKLDVRFGRVVDSIHYDDGQVTENGNPVLTRIVCTSGEVIEADQVVITTPLGLLKSDALDFDPPLPPWKRGAIRRMGFGLLNKVILLYEKPFWDNNRDMFGLLNEPERDGSLDPADYARKRGRLYLIWNATKTSGRPMLVALMAGNAAHDVETTDTASLVEEVSTRLRTVFGEPNVPAPLEVIVTRWKRDPFTRGTYSYVGPETRAGDYDLMAKPVGNLHFAGEATCGTHPATVHGAFLSGLRVAGEVMESMVGPIKLPEPLVKAAQPSHSLQKSASFHLTPYSGMQAASPWSSAIGPSLVTADQTQIKQEPGIEAQTVPITMPSGYVYQPVIRSTPRHSVCAGDTSFWVSSTMTDTTDLNHEAAIIAATLGEIGERPVKPNRPGVNPFLLFTKAKWDECKTQCTAQTGTPTGRDQIRQTLGKWWKAASQEDKQPFVDQGTAAQQAADLARKEWETTVVQWDKDAARIREDYLKAHPASSGVDGAPRALLQGIGVSRRKTNVSNNVVLDHI